MKHFHVALCLLGFIAHASANCTSSVSEFQLKGDYLIGGFFNIHYVTTPFDNDRPEAIDCSG